MREVIDLIVRAAAKARQEEDPRWHAVAAWLDAELEMHVGVAMAAARMKTASEGRVQMVINDDDSFPGSTLDKALDVARALLNNPKEKA